MRLELAASDVKQGLLQPRNDSREYVPTGASPLEAELAFLG